MLCHASLAPNDSLSQTLFSFFLVFFLFILLNYSIPMAPTLDLFLLIFFFIFFHLPLEISDDDKEEKDDFINVSNNFTPPNPNLDHSSQWTSATPSLNSTDEGSDLSWVCYVFGFGFGFGFFVHLCVGGFGFLVVSVFDGWILCGCWWCLWLSIMGLPLVVVMKLSLDVGFIFSK